MSEKLDSKFIKTHSAFISQDGFIKLLESPDGTDESVAIKGVVRSYFETLDQILDLSVKIQDLINSSIDSTISKEEEKHTKKETKKLSKLQKLERRNKKYPYAVRNYHLGLSALSSSTLLLASVFLLSSIYVAPTPALWPTSLLLTNSLISTGASVPAFFGVSYGLKKRFIKNKQSIKSKKRSMTKRMMLRSYSKEEILGNQLAEFQSSYSDRKTELNSVKTSVGDLILRLLDEDYNGFFDKHELLSEKFSALPPKVKLELVTLVKSLEESKERIILSHATLKDLKETRTTPIVDEPTVDEIEQLTIDDILPPPPKKNAKKGRRPTIK